VHAISEQMDFEARTRRRYRKRAKQGQRKWTHLITSSAISCLNDVVGARSAICDARWVRGKGRGWFLSYRPVHHDQDEIADP